MTVRVSLVTSVHGQAPLLLALTDNLQNLTIFLQNTGAAQVLLIMSRLLMAGEMPAAGPSSMKRLLLCLPVITC